MFEDFQGKFHIVRGQEVALDADVAQYYDVPTAQLNGQVTRRIAQGPTR